MTRVLAADAAGVEEAAALLRAGRLVAFGTETVYGLGGRADRAATIAAIYAAKQRPASNPLICHYADAADVAADADLGACGRALAQRFWPGPLTLVARRRPGHLAANVGPAATLAVRVPAHPAALALLRATGVAVAAPSANVSGRISPTSAAHVLAELRGRIDAVLDCGPCAVGVESTVVDVSGGGARLLRPGAVTREALTALLGALPGWEGGVLPAPGLLPAHYAPRARLRLDAADCAADEALLAFGPPVGTPAAVYQLSAAADVAEAARTLFAGLRHLDEIVAARRLAGIAAMPVPRTGVGEAVNDRLSRAAEA